MVLALHRLLAEPVEHGEGRLPFGHGIARKTHIAEVERYLTCSGETHCVVERLGEVGQQHAKLRLAMQTMLAVGQEQTMRRRLVEGGAMADRSEHVEEWLVGGGRVIRRRARQQRDVRRMGDRRAFRDQPAVSRMQVIAHQHRRALAPEALPDQIRVTERLPAVTMHQRIDNRAARPTDDGDAVVELRGMDIHGSLSTSSVVDGNPGHPAGKGPAVAEKRCRALGRRHRRTPGLRRMRAGDRPRRNPDGRECDPGRVATTAAKSTAWEP